jgi:hypothetical protein
MIKQTAYFVAAILLSAVVLHAQQVDEPSFAVLERAVKEDAAGWAGDKERLSNVFDAERKRLGVQFKSELLKWIENDVERHYWISEFLANEAYLHGNTRLPELSLLIKQQGLALLAGKEDLQSQRHTVGLNVTAAVLSHELGLGPLAANYKTAAEMLIDRNPTLAAFIAKLPETERDRYDQIPSPVAHKRSIVVAVLPSEPSVGPGGPPALPRTPIMGGILNGKAIKLAKPEYPVAARAARISGLVQVQILISETGRVLSAEAINGPMELRKAAEEAAWLSEFSPTKLSGQPMKVSGIVAYNFVAR